LGDDVAFGMLDFSGCEDSPWNSRRPESFLVKKDLTVEEKTYLANLHLKGKNSLKLIADAYSIPSELKKWDIQMFVRKVQNNPVNPFENQKPGRKRKHDEISEKVISDALGGNKRIQLSEDETKELMDDEAEKTGARRNIAPSQIKKLTNLDAKRIKSRLKILTRGSGADISNV
jgi:hypothetical protein